MIKNKNKIDIEHLFNVLKFIKKRIDNDIKLNDINNYEIFINKVIKLYNDKTFKILIKNY